MRYPPLLVLVGRGVLSAAVYCIQYLSLPAALLPLSLLLLLCSSLVGVPPSLSLPLTLVSSAPSSS